MDDILDAIRDDVLKASRKNAHTGRLIIAGISFGALTCLLSYADIARSGFFANI